MKKPAVGGGNQSPLRSEVHDDPETKLIGRVALYAFLLNLGLAVMKGCLAFFSSSLAVTAGAIDSATDSFASLALYGGLKLSTRRTPSFPLGLYKIENLLSVFVALSIFFAGFEIARELFTRDALSPRISLGVVVLLVVGVAATCAFGQYAIRIGRQTESPTLIAEGRHRQVDVLSSLVVLVSVLPDYFGWHFSLYGLSIDQIAAGALLIFIARAGWDLLSDGMRVLLDASLDFETLDSARSILRDHPMVVSVKSLSGRNAGRFRFLQANVILRTGDLEKAHQISQELEHSIREKIPHVEHVDISYEPQPRTHIRIAVPLSDAAGTVSRHFGESPFFAILTLRLANHGLEEKDIIENPHKDLKTAKGIHVAEWLVQKKVDQVFIAEDLSHKGPSYVFSNAGVTTQRTDAESIKEILENLKAE
ncbi:cation diffusion facilitator family transporter [Syntrophus gentianae]|uniref:Cation diffusion facilitator family transporter n=1 Tax=Syntrophus gentianae TaxID=43775 RepID=A0A1H7V522_9BACT|nr:cation diffusion facilitator family transporter [Syntrophus gentianae]SEM04194.1 cation diffusion facilitator family transporter [Syntrophus gentianae]